MADVQLLICGLPKDHKCNSDGPSIVFKTNGEMMLESEAMKLSDWPRGWQGGSVTCSICKRSNYETSMWRE